MWLPWSFADYQHLQKYFYNWNITLYYCFIHKINIRGNFIWKCIWSGHILEIQGSVWYWPERVFLWKNALFIKRGLFMKKGNLFEKRALFLKKGHQIFHPSYSIPSLTVLHQNKALYNFRKRAAFDSQMQYWMQYRPRIYPAGDIKCPYLNNMISPTVKKCKWLKKLCTNSANDHVLQSFWSIFLMAK